MLLKVKEVQWGGYRLGVSSGVTEATIDSSDIIQEGKKYTFAPTPTTLKLKGIQSLITFNLNIYVSKFILIFMNVHNNIIIITT